VPTSRRTADGFEELHKSLGEQKNERLLEGGVHIMKLKRGLLKPDSPEVQLLKDH